MKIKISLMDDKNHEYVGEATLTRIRNEKVSNQKITYRPGTTIEKIHILIDEGFFAKNRTITDIVNELKNHDFHYNSTDLTLPLRKIIRDRILKRTKELPDGKMSKQWTYMKAET